jgi:serine/threonine-protein kinase
MGTLDSIPSGAAIGGFAIDAPIGEGGAGVVYRGHDAAGSAVAVKVLQPRLVGVEEAQRRFMREVGAMGRVRHPNVVRVLASGMDEGRPYLVTPYYAGGSMEARIHARGPFGSEAISRLLAELGGALDALHAAGLVHRDVKPSNVFLAPDGSAVLGDLGLVRPAGASMLTRAGALIGTLDYLAPEAILGEEPSAAGDVYALACTMYVAATGRPPFTGPNALAVGVAHLEAPPPDARATRPDLPVTLCAAILAGMAKEPAERPRGAGALVSLARASSSSSPG